jgi:8-amino-7-oxononanoate synthase
MKAPIIDVEKSKKVALLKQMDLYPFFRAIEESDGTQVTIKGKKQIMIGSNNYLGLTHHPEVIDATQKAVARYGTGCTGSRFLNGSFSVHEELEEKLARYLGKEKAIVFSTGMQANLGALSSICGKDDCLILDSENHASILDAAKLSNGITYKYKHGKMASLERVLTATKDKYKVRTIVTDGIFSMNGEIALLPEIVALAKEHHAYVYVDDAHGLGVLGRRGRGTANHFDVEKDVDFIMGTFSKSFASIGGVLAGSAETMDHVRHVARSFIFSASMPPSAVATVLKCLEIADRSDDVHIALKKNVDFMRAGFDDIGFYYYNSQTPILPIFVGDDIKAMKITKYLNDNGIFATPVIAPAVGKGEALIRTSYMASHKISELQIVLEVLKKVKTIFDVPSERVVN